MKGIPNLVAGSIVIGNTPSPPIRLPMYFAKRYFLNIFSTITVSFQ